METLNLKLKSSKKIQETDKAMKMGIQFLKSSLLQIQELQHTTDEELRKLPKEDLIKLRKELKGFKATIEVQIKICLLGIEDFEKTNKSQNKKEAYKDDLTKIRGILTMIQDSIDFNLEDRIPCDSLRESVRVKVKKVINYFHFIMREEDK